MNGIQQMQVAGWSSALVLGSLLAGIALIVALVNIERRSQAPLVDLRLFRHQDFLGAATIALLANYVRRFDVLRYTLSAIHSRL